MDTRIALECGYKLRLGDTIYEILCPIGFGSNAFAYLAQYPDNLQPDTVHQVILKELFPYHPKGLIFRAPDGSLSVVPEEEAFFEMHKRSFLRGNRTHIDFQNDRADLAAPHINTYEKNRTLYSIMAQSNGQTLRQVMTQKRDLLSLGDIVACIINLLDALSAFHAQGLLHLDISPENILLLPLHKGRSEHQRKLMLIDYNSSWSLEDLAQSEGITLDAKENYASPEVRMNQREAVAPASDLFSVAAIFWELVQGRPLDFSRLYTGGALVPELEARFGSLPQSVVYKTVQILRMGLKLPPTQRYQSTQAMQDDLEQLQALIEGKGVTHSSLFEIGTRLNRHQPEPVFKPLVQTEQGILPMEALTEYRNVILTGESGLGKTVALKSLLKGRPLRYDPLLPVTLFIPLCEYDESPCFIQRWIVDKVSFSAEEPSFQDALYNLNRLLDTGGPIITLLLDGLNEASGHIKHLLKEINQLSKLPAVRMIVTARTEGTHHMALAHFTPARLLPPPDEAVAAYLQAAAVPMPEDSITRQLIQNPLMLKLYVDGQQMQSEKSAFIGSGDIVNGYLDSVVAFHRQQAVGDEAKQYQIAFIMEHLLPHIAHAMGPKTAVSQAELSHICEINYRRLSSKTYARAFPHYLGKSRVILENIKDAREWFDFAICEIAVKELALISCQGESYRFGHRAVQDALAGRYPQTRRAYLAALAKYKLLPSLAIALVIGAGMIGLQRAMPGSYPVTAEQINLNSMAMNGVVSAMTGMDEQLRNEKNVLKGLLELEPSAAQEKIAQALLKNDLIRYEPINAALFVHTPLDIRLLEDLYSLPKQHNLWQRDMLERFACMVAEDSIYTPKMRAKAVADYQEYLSVYEKMIFAKIYKLMQPLNETGRKDLLKALSYSSEIGNVYLLFDVPDDPQDLDNIIFKAEERLGSLNQSLDIVRRR